MSAQCTNDDRPTAREVSSPGEAVYTVVLVRHAESTSNVAKPQKYSGWENVDLTNEGVQQAKRAGVALKNLGYKFDVAHTSLLTRAQRTLAIILEEMGQADIPQCRTWRLNEQHFGDLNGMTREEILEKYGRDGSILDKFRTPPPMAEDHPHYKSIRENIARYPKECPAPHEFPQSESLKQTVDRTLPYWNEVIVPQITAGKKVLIAGHGANLKGLIMYLENMPEKDVNKFMIPNAIPFLYKFDKNMKPVEPFKYLC